MKFLTKTELRLRFDEICKKIEDGAVFIHPTDTIYGLGCNAQNKKAVKKIRQLKERFDKPFSIWTPSIDWIKDNCRINKNAEWWLEQLPGPYTFILKKKNADIIAENVTLKLNSIGVRYPDHWFSNIVKEINIPTITTSANKAGQPFMTCLDDLDPEIKKGTDFIIYEGEKKARPSKIINLVKEEVKER